MLRRLHLVQPVLTKPPFHRQAPLTPGHKPGSSHLPDGGKQFSSVLPHRTGVSDPSPLDRSQRQVLKDQAIPCGKLYAKFPLLGVLKPREGNLKHKPEWKLVGVAR